MSIKIETLLEDVRLFKPDTFEDARGFFSERYKMSENAKQGCSFNIKQVNHTQSKKNVLCGLHYQLPPKAQGKYIFVIKGGVWDVAVDIRKTSLNFKKWVGVELSDKNRNAIYIPPGFAHGFVALDAQSELIYLCTEEWSRENERGIAWNDPVLNISWPIKNPILSVKDENQPFLEQAEVF